MTDPERAPQDFENPFEEPGSAEERVFQTLLQTRTPTAASAIADGADCDGKTARKYLQWFARLGIATEHDGEPATYERNDRYFEWRRANDLAARHTPSELAETARSLTERIQRYRDRYDAAVPADVDALHPPDGVDVETAYAELTDWESLRAERRAYERARQLSGEGSDVAEV